MIELFGISKKLADRTLQKEGQEYGTKGGVVIKALTRLKPDRAATDMCVGSWTWKGGNSPS